MKNRFTTTILAIAALAFAIAPAAIAADLTDIGYLDQSAIGSLPAFVNANAQMAVIKQQFDAEYAAAMKAAKTDAQKQSIAMSFQQKFSDDQREIIGPMYSRAQLAIAQISAGKKLSVVLDKRVIVYGGVDITKDVVALITNHQAIAAPSASPVPSEIGFVDQSALDSSPKIKQADTDLAKFASDQRTAYAAKVAAAKTDTDRQALIKEYDATLTAKRDELLKPLADQMKSVTGSVAAKKSLLLVVDRADIVFGGTDITQDVQNALTK